MNGEDGKEGVWRWTQCTKCALRRQRPIIGEPLEHKCRWTCTHCQAIQNEDEKLMQLACALHPVTYLKKHVYHKNYNYIRIGRAKKEGGGTLMYIHHSCEFQIVELPFLCP